MYQNKKELLEMLLEMLRQGQEVATLVGVSMAQRLQDLLAQEKIERTAAEIQQILQDLQIDEEELALRKQFGAMDLDQELAQLKKDLGL